MAHEKLRAAFASAVPEVAAGVVVLRGVAGEPGGHCKVAVQSLDCDVDPVEACVGPRGGHLARILAAVGGTLDLVDWSPDPLVNLRNALQPCVADRIELGPEVVLAGVAYGYRGDAPPADFAVRVDRHVRLAAELTGTTLALRGAPTTRRIADDW